MSFIPQKPSVSFILQLVKLLEPYLHTIETLWSDRKITGFQFTTMIYGCCTDHKAKRIASGASPRKNKETHEGGPAAPTAGGDGGPLGAMNGTIGSQAMTNSVASQSLTAGNYMDFMEEVVVTSDLIYLPMPPADLTAEELTEKRDDGSYLAKLLAKEKENNPGDDGETPRSSEKQAYLKQNRDFQIKVQAVHSTLNSKRDVNIETFDVESYLMYCLLGIFTAEAAEHKTKTLTFTDFRAFILQVTLGAKAAVEEFDVKPITLTRTMKSKHLYHMNRMELVKDLDLIVASMTGTSDHPSVLRTLDVHTMQVAQEMKLKMNQGHVNCLLVVSVVASVLSKAKLNLLFVATSDNQLRAYDMSRLKLIRAKIPFKETQQIFIYVKKLNLMLFGGQRGTLAKVSTVGIEKWAHSHDPAKCFPATPSPHLNMCHGDMVTGLELDGLCETVFSCSMDRNICQVNIKTWQTLRTIKGHKLGILSIAYNPFYNTLVTCGMEYVLYSWALEVWHVEPMLLTDMSQPYMHPIQQVRTVDNKPLAISLDAKGLFKVWDLRNGQCVSSASCEPEMIRAEMSNLYWPWFALDPVTLDIVTAANRKCYIFEYDVDDKALGPYCAHEGSVSGALVDRMTNTLFSTSKQELQAWDIPTLRPINRIRELVTSKITATCLLPAIGCLVLGTANGVLTVVRTSNLSAACSWVQQSQSRIVDISLAPRKMRPKKHSEWSSLGANLRHAGERSRSRFGTKAATGQLPGPLTPQTGAERSPALHRKGTLEYSVNDAPLGIQQQKRLMSTSASMNASTEIVGFTKNVDRAGGTPQLSSFPAPTTPSPQELLPPGSGVPPRMSLNVIDQDGKATPTLSVSQHKTHRSSRSPQPDGSLLDPFVGSPASAMMGASHGGSFELSVSGPGDAMKSSLGGTIPEVGGSSGAVPTTAGTAPGAGSDMDRYSVFCTVSSSGHAEVLVVDSDSWTIEACVLLRNEVSIRASCCQLYLDGFVLLVGEYDNTVSYWEPTSLNPPHFKEIMVGVNVPPDRACVALAAFEGPQNLPLFCAADSAGWFHFWATGETNMWTLARWPNKKPPELKNLPKTTKMVFDSTHMLLIIGDDFGQITIFDISCAMLGEKGKFKGMGAKDLTIKDVPSVHHGRMSSFPPCIAYWEAHPESSLTTLYMMTSPFLFISGGEDCRLQMWSLGGGAMSHFVLRKIGQEVNEATEQVDLSGEDVELYNDLPFPYGHGGQNNYDASASANLLEALSGTYVSGSAALSVPVSESPLLPGSTSQFKQAVSFSGVESSVAFDLANTMGDENDVGSDELGDFLDTDTESEEDDDDDTQENSQQQRQSRSDRARKRRSRRASSGGGPKLPKLPPIPKRFFHRDESIKTKDGEVVNGVPQYIGLERLDDDSRPKECAYITDSADPGGTRKKRPESSCSSLGASNIDFSTGVAQASVVSKAMYGPLGDFKKMTDLASVEAATMYKVVSRNRDRMASPIKGPPPQGRHHKEAADPRLRDMSDEDRAEALQQVRRDNSPTRRGTEAMGVGNTRELRMLAAKASTSLVTSQPTLDKDSLLPQGADLGPVLGGGANEKRPRRLGALTTTPSPTPYDAIARGQTVGSTSEVSEPPYKQRAGSFSGATPDPRPQPLRKPAVLASDVPSEILRKRAKSVEPMAHNHQGGGGKRVGVGAARKQQPGHDVKPFVLGEGMMVPTIRPLAGVGTHTKTHKSKAF